MIFGSFGPQLFFFVLRYAWTHRMAVANFLFVGRICSKLKDDILLPGRGNARIQIFCSWTFGKWTFQNKTQRGFKLSRLFCLEHFGKARVSMGTCTLWKFYTKLYGTWKWHPWRRDSFKNCISFKWRWLFHCHCYMAGRRIFFSEKERPEYEVENTSSCYVRPWQGGRLLGFNYWLAPFLGICCWWVVKNLWAEQICLSVVPRMMIPTSLGIIG